MAKLRVYDKLIGIQKYNADTDSWEAFTTLHAYVNKAKNDSEKYAAGAIRPKSCLIFEFRYFSGCKAIELNTEIYRVIYNGNPYDIVSYDNFEYGNKTVRLIGEFF